MEEKIDISKIREKYPSFFEAFSFRLIDFALGGQMAQKIANICIENRVLDQEKIQRISYRITFVVFGRMDKEKLPLALEEEAGVSREAAVKITKSVEDIIFSQINKIKEGEEKEKKEEKQEEEKSPVVSVNPPSRDTYRESID